MAAQSDADPLPEYGSQAYDELGEAFCQAAECGDLATLQHAGAAALLHVDVSPLQLALRSRQAHVVAWLVEESERTGIDIASGWKAIHLAAYRGDMGRLEAASDEELSLLMEGDETVLHAAMLGDQAEAIKYLVRERGLDVSEVDDEDCAVLVRASRYGCVSAIDALVECGARVHEDEPGEPSKALMRAAESGQVEAMEKLVQLGANVGLVGRFGGAVHTAAEYGSVEAIDAAVRLGADPRAVDFRGWTALHVAAVRNEPDVMRRLVQLGVGLDSVDYDGRTALHIASSCCLPGAGATCRALLELGADRWVKDKDGENAGEVATSMLTVLLASERVQQVVEVLDSYWPIVPSMAQLLLGLRGPTESSLTRFAAHSAFEPKVLSLVNCLLVGKENKAYDKLVEECSAGSGERAKATPSSSSSSPSSSSSSRAAKKQRQG